MTTMTEETDTPGTRPTAVLLVDDHQIIRDGIRAMLEDNPDINVIGEATNGHEALSQARELKPDIVLMDVRMPICDGIAATTHLKKLYPTIPVLILTAHENTEYLIAALKAGAAGYVLKDTTSQNLRTQIGRVLDGEQAISQDLANRMLKQLALEREQLSESNNLSHLPSPEMTSFARLGILTTRELDTLKLIALGCSNPEIAMRLHLSKSTVKTYVERIIKKLGVSDRTQAAVRGIELGIVPASQIGVA